VVVVQICSELIDRMLYVQRVNNIDKKYDKSFYQVCNRELSSIKILLINRLIELVKIDLKIDSNIYVCIFRQESANECIDRTFYNDYKNKIIADRESAGGFIYNAIEENIIFLKDNENLIQLKNTFLHEAFHIFQKSNIKNMGLMQNYDRLFHLYIEGTACKYAILRG